MERNQSFVCDCLRPSQNPLSSIVSLNDTIISQTSSRPVFLIDETGSAVEVQPGDAGWRK